MRFSSRQQDYENLFRLTYPKLHVYATYILGDGEEAKDVVSDCFVALWGAYCKTEGADAASYLFKMVRNRCFDLLRHRKTVDDYLGLAQMAGEIDSDSWEEFDERIDRIMHLIEDMPPQMRFAIEQCYLHEKKYAEVAQMMGISTEGVKRHIVRGLARIRAFFNINYKKGCNQKSEC